jgi:hypothetical protein
MFVGCIDTDAAVFVEARIDSPAVAVEGSQLVTGVTGGFTLELHLGPRASGSSSATLQSFSLVSNDGTKTIVAALGFSAAPPSPITVEPDSTALLAVTLAANDNQLATAARDAICAGPIRVRGVIEDSLRGTAITIDSESFSASGCR